MGQKQSTFLNDFKLAFTKIEGFKGAQWTGGQQASNTSGFANPPDCRRQGKVKSGERFELGDLKTRIFGYDVIVEYESDSLPLSNILKYWPYVRGEFTEKPDSPILVCHFSNWRSYATRRDLWHWTLNQMRLDKNVLVCIDGKQFDHGGEDDTIRHAGISQAIAWLVSILKR